MNNLHKLLLLVLPFIISITLSGQQKYTTIQNGAWNVQDNWLDNNIPPSSLGSQDTIIVNHDMVLHSDQSVLGLLVIDNAGSITANHKQKLKIGKGGTDLGELINYGTITVEKIEVKPDNGCDPSMTLPAGYNYGIINVDKLHIGNNCGAGSFYNYIGGKINIDKELHLDNYMCNQDTITIGSKFKNHGGIIDCCGFIETPLVEISQNSSRPGTFKCINICSMTGSDTILKVGMTLYNSLAEACINAPASEAIFDNDSTMVCGLNEIGTPLLLPINLSYFGTQISNNNVIIKWTTLSESNNDYFTIERSNDFTNWSTLTKTPGKARSITPTHYEVVDEHPYLGYIHYRLKQTDYNGNYTYSEISSIDYKEQEQNVNIFPNPTNNIINITGSKEQLELISIWNSIGIEVSNSVYIDQNSVVIKSIDLSHLKPGLYYVRTGTITQKIYKL